MNQRTEIVKYVLETLGKPHHDEYVKKMLPAFWMNPRQKATGGLRLTDSGQEWQWQDGILVSLFVGYYSFQQYFVLF